MADEKISIKAVELALAALEEGLRENAAYPQLLTTRDGAIQRFEFVVDTSRQVLLRVLKEVFGLSEATAQKDTFREAAKLGLVADGESWIAHVNARNRTSHTYDSKIAEQVFAHVPTILPDARDLLKRLRPHVG
jgi:nucleotidyltransferase substrate binding protein (TIGR01987 family)